MKTYIKYIVTSVCIAFFSCTDVIDVDLQDAAPRLVIEASIDWEKGSLGNNQVIRLSTSTPYFNNQSYNPVIGASVKVTNDLDNSEFIFEDMNNGTYSISTFIPVENQSYTLEVNYNNETYIATETMVSVVDIANVYQSIENGFDDEALEVNIDFDDPINEENYYLFKFQEEGDLLPELLY